MLKVIDVVLKVTDVVLRGLEVVVYMLEAVNGVRCAMSAGAHALHAALYSGGRGGRGLFARGARVMRMCWSSVLCELYALEVVLHVLEVEKGMRHCVRWMR